VGDVWITGAVAVFFVALAGSIMSCSNPIPYAIMSTLIWFLPMLTAILGLLLTTGFMMAYYIPLIPFMIFTFSAMGWLIGVIESMIAAPLVALGIAHPEGNPLMGKAEPALMLITNIFLRPSLMVIGLICGIIMSYVAVWLLNIGFMAASQIVFQNAQGISWYLAWAALMLLYTILVITILNKVFTLIHLIPDNIMRWLSGGAGAALGSIEVGQMMGESKGQMEGASKAVGDAAAGQIGDAGKQVGGLAGKPEGGGGGGGGDGGGEQYGGDSGKGGGDEPPPEGGGDGAGGGGADAEAAVEGGGA
jgi:defect-in-organelle-trafficking protein DotA